MYSKIRSFLAQDQSGSMSADMMVLMAVVVVGGFYTAYAATSSLKDGMVEIDNSVSISKRFIKS